MKNVLILLAVLLLAFVVSADQTMAKDRPFGYPDDGESHPWGGDEATYDPEGDGFDPARASVTITTSIPVIDFLITEFLVKPRLLESIRVTNEQHRISAYEAARRSDYYLSRTPYNNRTDLQR
ncbi:hypothetical protein KQH82_05200 [bacterium]|nr:hypothetical protein [bacterium]